MGESGSSDQALNFVEKKLVKKKWSDAAMLRVSKCLKAAVRIHEINLNRDALYCSVKHFEFLRRLLLSSGHQTHESSVDLLFSVLETEAHFPKCQKACTFIITNVNDDIRRCEMIFKLLKEPQNVTQQSHQLCKI